MRVLVPWRRGRDAGTRPEGRPEDRTPPPPGGLPPNPVLVERYLRRRELLRAAIGDVLDGVHGDRHRTVVTVAADQALRAALDIAVQEAATDLDRAPTRIAIVAMGRLGGAELGYGSDADVLFVHDPDPGVAEDVAQEFAVGVAGRVRGLLGDPGSELALPVDAALRPEGRHGPIARSLESYTQYYERWAEPWEFQALLRARPVAGDAETMVGAERSTVVKPTTTCSAALPAGRLRGRAKGRWR